MTEKRPTISRIQQNKESTEPAAVQETLEKRNRRKQWSRLFAVMACVVVFVTTYGLILPAITAEKEDMTGTEIAGAEMEQPVAQEVGEGEDSSPQDDSAAFPENESGEVNVIPEENVFVDPTVSPGQGNGETVISANEADCRFTVSCNESAAVPEGSELSVTEITEDSEEYASYLSKAESALKDNEKVTFARFFDITILQDGQEIQPENPVSVRIELEDELNEEVKAVHFGEEVDVLDAALEEGGKHTESAVVFDAEGFSVYGVVTVENIDELDGKTYGVMNTRGGTKPQGIALTTTASENNTKLKGKNLTVRVDTVGRAENVYVAENSNITMWTFTAAGDGKYYVSTTSGNALKYLKISSNGVSLTDSDPTQDPDCHITIKAGTGTNAGKYKFSTANGALGLNGSAFERKTANSNGDAVWMNFAELSNLNTDDFVTYTATKVSVSDPVNVPDGAQIVVYTRIWNNETKRYDYYAVDHDGMLVKAYESGDTISWVGSKVNTMLWDFTEYRNSDGTPNYYYELQNAYSGKYLAPQVSGGTLSDDPVGVNLNGRRNGQYFSSILAWDDASYDYASLTVKNGKLISAPISKAGDFYFAVMTVKETGEENALSTVKPIDHEPFGISLKMQDYENINSSNRSQDQVDVLGNTKYIQWTGSPGLLKKNLEENGYPMVAEKGHTNNSLQELYNETMDVHRLFMESTYRETGYFEYDSTQNFAHLITRANDPWIGKPIPGSDAVYGIGDFVIYDQLGTTDEGNKDTLKHGQFLPYNDITKGFDEAGNPIPAAVSTKYKNEMDIRANPLSSLDPRKGENLYSIPYKQGKTAPDYVDHFFGMEMSARFMQNERGLDDWGHDLIFEFSGDDDFWLYIDGKLVLDLGGIHSALDGKVNFRTGKVVVNNRETDLRTLYKEAYKEEHPDASEASVNEWLNTIFKDDGSNTGTVFKDYTGHSMKVFFMERGAGASNLHMRFNLAPYREGEVLLEKEVTGTDNADMSFPFQIYVKDTNQSGSPYVLWGGTEGSVRDFQTGEALSPQTYTAEGLQYENVFMLRPGQTIAVQMPSENTEYYIKECALDSGLFDRVEVNGGSIEGTNTSVGNRKDYTISDTTVFGRKKVVFNNHVSSDSLKSLNVTKRLWQDFAKTQEIHSGTGTGADNTGFRFRLYIGKNGNNEYEVYNAGRYYVKDPGGHYCIYQNGGFVSTGKTDFSELNAEVPEGGWKSEQERATFHTSPGGAADKLPAGYSIEIPGLLPGTPYKVEEWDEEIPAGYNRIGYSLTEGPYSPENPGVESNTGEISSEMNDETVSVHNQHGYGLVLKKVWSDAAFMDDHEEIYFAVYLKGEGGGSELLRDSLRQLGKTETEIRWFFPELESGKTLNDYEIYEVKLSGDFTVENGVVTLGDNCSVIRIENETSGVVIHGNSNDQGYSDEFEYTVTYDRDYLTDEQIANRVNSRTDTTYNTRTGIKLFKTDMSREPLAGAVFELSDNGGKTKTFTSDENGLIATAYLEEGKEYTLTETAAPYGYRSLIGSVTVRVRGSDIYVNGSMESGTANGYYTIDQVSDPTPENMPSVTIRNKPLSLKAVKVDSSTGAPVQNVEFALYREVHEYGTNAPMPDYEPMEGYESLVTDQNGIIPKLVLRNKDNPAGLRPGVYYLREEAVPSGYKALGIDIRVTISDTGEVTLESAKRPAQSGSWTIGTISTSIANTSEDDEGRVTITVRNTPKDPVRISKVDMVTKEALPDVSFELYGIGQVENGEPKEGENPLNVNTKTGADGILMLGGLEENTSYYLFETQTLDGYNLLPAPVVITTTGNRISASMDGTPLTCQKTNGVWEITVENSTGYELPSTGGPGTEGFMAAGGLMVIGAAALLIRRITAGIR